MKKICNWLLNASILAVLPGIAGAAGTYYNNSVYQRYGTNSMNNSKYGATMNNRGYANRYGQQTTTTTGYRQTRTIVSNNGMMNRQNMRNNTQPTARKQGFVFDAGITHELAYWDFNMNTAGSNLHYDDLLWNVIDGQATYYFGDTTPMQIKVGARYGLQFDESPMVDDDISQGGYGVMTWTNENGDVLGYQTGHALSVGTSKDGSQLGFNASLGLTDFFKWGPVKMTPSVGYRYLKYKLSTKQNYGVTLDIFEATDEHAYVTCISGYLGEIQCDPFLLFYSSNGAVTISGREVNEGVLSDVIVVPGNMTNLVGVGTGGTYYYEQSGTSHEYETTWAGPYVALDFEYAIDNKNAVTGGLELGLPVYTSEGNQPYRYDWAHPKSVEDSGEFGDAIHLGLNAMWKTMVSDSTMLTVGFTYDYYKVSDATAKTFLSSSYYTDLYEAYEDAYDASTDESEKAMLEDEMDVIEGYRAAGWKLESSKEINSVYRSMGIRVGVNVKF